MKESKDGRKEGKRGREGEINCPAKCISNLSVTIKLNIFKKLNSSFKKTLKFFPVLIKFPEINNDKVDSLLSRSRLP